MKRLFTGIVKVGWVGLVAVALVACPGGQTEPDAAGDTGPDAVEPLPACELPGSLFTRDNADVDHPLAEGGEVGVVLGFQGFIFMRLGVYSPYELPESVRIEGRSVVESDMAIDVVAKYPPIRTVVTPEGNAQTDAVWVFFNNNPMTDLIGHAATLTLRVPTMTCMLDATVDVQLVNGGLMGEEGFEGCEPACAGE